MQNGTEQVNGVLFDCLATYTGMSYILWASRHPCGTYKAGRWLCAPSDSELGTRNSELGVRDSEFLSVVRSTADGLREACGALWISIPTQTGLSRYTVSYDSFVSILEKAKETVKDSYVAQYPIGAPKLKRVWEEEVFARDGTTSAKRKSFVKPSYWIDSISDPV